MAVGYNAQNECFGTKLYYQLYIVLVVCMMLEVVYI